MESEKIKNLDELLGKFLKENIEIVDKKITNLTAPGENYMSDMLLLELTTKNKENGTISVKEYVAKCVVAEKDNFMGDFNTFIFKKEIDFYTEIIPTIQQTLRENGLPEVDIFPEMLAARLNLLDEEKPDENAVIILENLNTKGYQNGDRHNGFDLEEAKIILSDLAAFHAIPLAIKIRNPELFDKKIRDMCKTTEPPLPPPDKEDSPLQGNSLGNILKQILKEEHFRNAHLERLDDIIKLQEENMKEGLMFKESNSLFSTMAHNDMWMNNTMQIRSEDGKIIKNKFLDFQMVFIKESTIDVVFFLITSVDVPTLENHFDYLLKYYHEEFIKILESLKCDVTPYNFDNFIDQINKSMIDTMMHASFMNMQVIFAKKGHKVDFEKDKCTVNDIHPIAKQKFTFMFKKIVETEGF